VLREEWLKPALYFLLAVLAVLLLALTVRRVLSVSTALRQEQVARVTAGTAICGLALPALALFSPGLFSYMTFSRFALDSNHFWVAVAVVLSGLWLAVSSGVPMRRIAILQYGLAGVAVFAGGLMVLKVSLLAAVTRYAYSIFDLTVVAIAVVSIALAAMRLLKRPVVCP
jgi:hypothetical protein